VNDVAGLVIDLELGQQHQRRRFLLPRLLSVFVHVDLSSRNRGVEVRRKVIGVDGPLDELVFRLVLVKKRSVRESLFLFLLSATSSKIFIFQFEFLFVLVHDSSFPILVGPTHE